jgi:acetoacetyl-CoA synthetase
MIISTTDTSTTNAAVTAELIRPPADDVLTGSEIGKFLAWLTDHRGVSFTTYEELHDWSVMDLDGFWSAIWAYFGVHSDTPYESVVGSREMPGTRWFPGATLNYAQHILARRPGAPAVEEVAIIAQSQTRNPIELSWGQLRDQVARARKGLQRLGIGRGDRVAAYLPNIPETVVAFLATASLGATWAACAPEFGARSVIDRFAQIEPTVLLTIGGYGYGAKDIDRRGDVEQIRAGLPTLASVVHVPYGPNTVPGTVSWDDLLSEPGELVFESVPFEHPLCVLFSSGTTGKPKAIVHCHGGILLEHLKNHSLSWDLKAGDRMLWFSTTAWMMWNALVSGLLVGSTIVLIDGNPLYPDLTWQWRLAEETQATLMGASPGFLMACRKEGIAPAKEFDLSRIRQIGAAGSPLPAEGFHWVAEQFGPNVLLNVGSGGTDVCSGIVQGSPLQPVWAGEIAGPCLGVAAKAFDEHGHEVPAGELGELVITAPMPSMPVGFWGDDDGSRYRAAYFEEYPGIWRHGDWIRFSVTGSCVIAGRSDATLNRGGVRLGTAEFYRVVEELPGVVDSLVVHLEDPAGGNGELLLYVHLQTGVELDDQLRRTIVSTLRTSLSPRHIPDTITAVPAIPRNRTGKKLELPVKKILLGAALDDVASREVLADPASLDPYVEHAATRRTL